MLKIASVLTVSMQQNQRITGTGFCVMQFDIHSSSEKTI